MFDFISDMDPTAKGFLGGAAVILIPLVANFAKDIYFDRRKRKAERAYISVQLVFLLDKFVARCADVSWDDGYDPRDYAVNDDDLEDQTIIPAFDMSSVKGEHKYLTPNMLARLQFIEIKLNQANEELCDPFAEWTYGGNNWMYFERRRRLYADVGYYAASIANDLRTRFKIEVATDWKPVERIQRSMQQLDEKKADREERRRQRKAERERKAASAKETATE